MSTEYLRGKATVWPEEDNQAPQTVYFEPPKSHKYNARWLVLWQDGSDIGVSMIEQAKMEKPLTQTEYRVRDYLMGTIGIGNCVYVNQSEVARELNIHRISVVNAIKRLIELGILIQGPKSGRNNTYTVSPAFCFSGKLGIGIKERKKAIKNGKASATILQFKQKSLLEIED